MHFLVCFLVRTNNALFVNIISAKAIAKNLGTSFRCVFVLGRQVAAMRKRVSAMVRSTPRSYSPNYCKEAGAQPCPRPATLIFRPHSLIWVTSYISPCIQFLLLLFTAFLFYFLVLYLFFLFLFSSLLFSQRPRKIVSPFQPTATIG